MNAILRVSDSGRSVIKQNEGLRLTAYRDTVGLWTIGYGHCSTNPRPARGMVNGVYEETRVCEGLTITKSEADRLFAEDIAEVEAGVSALISTDPSQGVFDALGDLGFQFGSHKLDGSKVIKAVNFNPRSTRVMEEMMMWMRAGGKPQEPLYRRRARNVCQCWGLPIPPMLWTKEDFPWGVLPSGEIDFSRTMPIDMILAIARDPDGAAMPVPPEPPPITLDTPAPVEIDLPEFKVEAEDQTVIAHNAVAESPEPPREQSPVPAVPPQPEGKPALVSPAAPVTPIAGPTVQLPPVPPPVNAMKHPLRSKTIMAGFALAIMPDLIGMGNQLIGLGISGSLGEVLRLAGFAAVVMGRIGAAAAVSIHAPIRKER